MATGSITEEVASKSLQPDSVQRITLADVAAKTGFHRSTVSQVLNNHRGGWTSATAQQRIRAAAEDLGYRPNLAARALRSGRSHVIGFVSPGFGVTSRHSWAGGLTEAAAKADYTVALSSHPNDSESEDLLIRRLMDRGVDGLAVYPVDSGPHDELRRLVNSGFPVITFEGANLLDFPSDDASVDLVAVGRLQARHLLDIGRRRICIANALPAARVNEIRDSGIEQELAAAGAPAPVRMDLGRPSIDEIPDPDAICDGVRAFVREHGGEFDSVASYDPIASLVIRVLLEQGLRVPEDVAVMGSGDETVASYGAIPLSSIDAQTDRLSAQAFEMLIERIDGRRSGSKYLRVISQMNLKVRKSTQA